MFMRNLLVASAFVIAFDAAAHAQSRSAVAVDCRERLAAPAPVRPTRDAARAHFALLKPCLQSAVAQQAATKLRNFLFAGDGRAYLSQLPVTREDADMLLAHAAGPGEIGASAYILTHAIVRDRPREESLVAGFALVGKTAEIARLQLSQAGDLDDGARLHLTTSLLAAALFSTDPERSEWLETSLRDLSWRTTTPDLSAEGHHVLMRSRALLAAFKENWGDAAIAYAQVPNPSGALTSQADSPDSTEGRGLARLLLSQPSAVAGERAAVAAMSGDWATAMVQLELARTVEGDAAAPNTAMSAVAALGARGETVVQIQPSIIGMLVVVSRRSANGMEHRAWVNGRQGGMTLYDFIVGERSTRGGFPSGLVPVYRFARESAAGADTSVMESLVEQTASKLDDILADQLRQGLTASGVRHGERLVIIVPASLTMAPFLAAHGGSPNPLALDYVTRFAPSAASALTTARSADAKATDRTSIALITSGALNANLEYARLERARLETEVRRHGLLVDGFDGSTTDMFARLRPFSIWHFLGHGFWDPDGVSYSGLYLSPRSVLYAQDVAQANFGKGPRLVFLSACETGLIGFSGDPNAHLGLQSTFLAAGATGVIGSLWPVSDVATTLLVAKFYDELLINRRDPATALQSAQIWISRVTGEEADRFVRQAMATHEIKLTDAAPLLAWLETIAPHEAPFARPYFWAGFQLYGA